MTNIEVTQMVKTEVGNQTLRVQPSINFTSTRAMNEQPHINIHSAMTSGTEYTTHKNEAKAEVMNGTLQASNTLLSLMVQGIPGNYKKKFNLLWDIKFQHTAARPDSSHFQKKFP
jgi:hypothetical protein